MAVKTEADAFEGDAVFGFGELKKLERLLAGDNLTGEKPEPLDAAGVKLSRGVLVMPFASCS